MTRLSPCLRAMLLVLLLISLPTGLTAAQTCPHDGDVNGDDRLTPGDALRAFQHFLGMANPVLSACQIDRADVNTPTAPDPTVTPADALCIFRRFLGLPSCLDGVALPLLPIQVTAPALGTLTNADSVQVSGTVSPAAKSVRVGLDRIVASLTNSTFTATVPLLEGINTITAVASNALGEMGTASVTVIRDTTPPSVMIESPQTNQIVTTPTITVVGMVNDIVTGTVNAENCRLMLSGPMGSVTAMVSNRTFMVTDFPLTPGPNTLTAVATDTAGNVSAPVTVQVMRREIVGQQLRIASGNNQEGRISQALPDPVVVQAVDVAGRPLANRTLHLRVERNNGLLRLIGAPTAPQAEISVVTDANGQASIEWTLGNRVGAGNNRIEVSGAGFPVPLMLSASGVAAPCDKLLAMSGDNQVGFVGTELPRPLEVVAVDAGGNFCVNLPITFRVAMGSGNFAGMPEVAVQTNADGRAVATLILGPDAGINNNMVLASFPGLTQQPASFMATAVMPVAGVTRFVGLVLDTENQPIPHALVRIEHTDPPIQTFTDDTGQFVLVNVPVGNGLLFVDGSTTTRPGLWPSLDLRIDVLAGIDNALGRPIFLPPLNANGFQLAGGDQDVVLTMAGVEGFALRVFARSATLHGVRQAVSMGVTQVSNDQVPMPPTGGAAPPWVGTFQPPGVILDPPAQLTVPNSLGLPPGQIVDLFSFDHDLQQFVGVGTGTVQPDGATIVSDPGSGLRKSGWFFDCPPPPPPACAPSCPACQHVVILDQRTCSYRCDPDANGTACDDGQMCTRNDKCQTGACVGEPVQVTGVMGSCVAAVNMMTACTVTADDPSGVEWMAPGGNPASGKGGSFSTAFNMTGTKTVTAFCGASSASKTVDVADSCDMLPEAACPMGYVSIGERVCEREVARAPDAGNFGQVKRLSHSAAYDPCVAGGRWCFRLRHFLEEHGIGASALGLTNITGANDAQITAATCAQVITDFTPVAGGGEQGAPGAPYSQFVPLHIVRAHEQFHVSDFRAKVTLPVGRDLAMFVAQAANCTDCKSDPPAAFIMQMEALWTMHMPTYFDGMHEARAYAAENALLATLVADIRARGAMAGWPAACR